MGKRKERRARKKPVRKAKVVEKAPRAGINKFYHDNYKTLLFIPFLLLLAAIIWLAISYGTTGQFVQTGVSLSGGITITIPTETRVDIEQLSASLGAAFPNDLTVREIAEFGRQEAITVQAAPATQEEDLEALEQALITNLEQTIPGARDTYTVEIIGPSLGQSFLQQTVIALIIAFVLMAIVVFLVFRTFIPSMAVVLAALSDIIVTLAVVSLLEIKLSTAGIAAFLMLIGYSVDTDILLSTRVLKRDEGTVYERLIGAMKTGVLMNSTTLAAIVAALLITQSEIISQIMIILLIGLIVDVINTWIQNAGILRWYAEERR